MEAISAGFPHLLEGANPPPPLSLPRDSSAQGSNVQLQQWSSSGNGDAAAGAGRLDVS